MSSGRYTLVRRPGADRLIPFLDLVTPHRELEEELIGLFRGALRSAAFIGGAEVEAFEREFADYCGTKFSVGVASGTDALCFALIGAGVSRGDAAVTVSHTFVATVEAIHHAGAEAEFIDIDERTYTMSARALDEYLASCSIDSSTGRPIGRRTGRPIKVIVPVHLYGQVADMNAIEDVARRYGLLIIEDACQAHGATYLFHPGAARPGTWRRAGSFGRAAAFSFYPSKNLGACGDAGAVTTDDEDLAATIRLLRDHGRARKHSHERQGYTARLDAVQAAVLRVKLRHLDVWNESRRRAARRYNEHLSSLPGVVTPCEPDGSRAVYHLYVLKTESRDELAAVMRSEGIQTGVHYPVPVHLQSAYRAARGEALPVTERAASEVLSLPMYPNITADQQERVVRAIRRFVRSRYHISDVGCGS